MGYEVTLQKAEFRILPEQFEEAIEAVKGLLDQPEKMGGLTYTHKGVTQRWYSFVDSKMVEQAETITHAMRAFRWHPVQEYNGGDVVDLEFLGGKLGDDKVFFEALAPFVVEGSYVQMEGDDGEVWRWCFEDGQVIEKRARIQYIWE